MLYNLKIDKDEFIGSGVYDMYRLLIIEDDNDINNLICSTFKKAGYECVQAYSGTEGLLYSRSEEFDLIILDLMLPGMKGEDVVSNIKRERETPVIVVSAKSSIDSRVELLTSGADDYLTKPFDIRELTARAALQIRKRGSVHGGDELLKYKDLTLDKNLFSVRVGNHSISLTKQEFKILELLIIHPDKVYSKQEIYDYAWDDVYIGEDKTVNVHISNIRKKLKAVSEEEYIETVWGIGFKLK